ncbi:FGGY-family carbohydrate kinase [Saccharopolyspora rectivirgula]|uniref:Sugar kinase n=1 Tax=Saccharopolyspora rectivirgula TaxID=28042 RepID=A0A073B3M3_9PSEU|nr:FGGY-family carbohydrate kinase [Saccharopolyspora rectivirgula]KEI46121.1 sugar kinase [Saccharopolyspora rectivirgula]
MITIGIDAGTSVVKSVAYAATGTELAAAQRPTRVVRPHPGWSEQDMDEVLQAVLDTVTELTARLAEPVSALAITAQGDGCWLVDAAGRPTGPALLWNDARASAIIQRWETDGLLHELFASNGSAGFAGLPHAQLSWLAEHQPERISRSAAVLTCGSWLFSRLTGRICWDSSDASNPFLDIRTGQYSTDVLDKLDLGWAHRLLPDVVEGQQRVAPLQQAVAEQLRIPAGTPVVLAAYDVVSTALGAGATRPGQACTILGTTICAEVFSTDPHLDRPPIGMTLRTPAPDSWLLANATLSGTEVIEWVCRLLGLPNPEDLTDLAENARAGSGGLLLLPYLSPAGERAPFHDPHARGSLHGLSLVHGPAEIARACLEGLAMVIHECLRANVVQPSEIRLTGGGAANRLWRQIIADVTGLPVVRTADAQAGAKGAVITARSVLERRSLSEVADELVTPADTVEPNPTDHDRYTEAFERFRAARHDAQQAGWYRPRS